MKEHIPQVRGSFKGLWSPAGSGNFFEDDETCPRDHLLICINCDFTYDGLINRTPFTAVTSFAVPFTAATPRRVHVIQNIEGQEGDFLIGTTAGQLYFYDGTSSGTLLYTHPDGIVIDYNFIPWADRIYIIANSSLGFDAPPISDGGMQVYSAAGIRPAGGTAPGAAANIANGLVGVVQAGDHFFGVAFETGTGFITPPAATNPAFLTSPGNQQIQFTNIPTGGAQVVARWLIATKVIPVRVPNDNLSSYISYFAARIPDNTTTAFNLNFRDSELLREASYLNDIYPVIPNGTSISSYRTRLCITAPATQSGTADRHDIIISRFGDPETFDQIDGVIEISPINQTVVRIDSVEVKSGLTDSQAYRDVLYLAKLDSTHAVSDNGDEPAFWPSIVVDQTIGARPYGIVPVKNPGSESVDYLLIAHTSGIYLFTGLYRRPEITWKVKQSFLELENINNRLYLVNNFNLRKIYMAVGNPTTELKLIDYNRVSPDLNNYHMDVKISNWTTTSLNNLFNFNTLFLRNNFISTFQSGTGILVESGIFTILLTPLDSVISVLIFPSDRDEDDKMIHLKSIRLKINRFFAFPDIDFGTILIQGIDFNSLGVNSSFSNTINLTNNTMIEPTITANVLGQRIGYQFVFSDHAVFNLVKFIAYVKPVYSTIPYQYVP